MTALLAANDVAPTAPCPRCGTGAWWRASTFPVGTDPGPWCCLACTPPPASVWIDACHMPAAHNSADPLSAGVTHNPPAGNLTKPDIGDRA